MHNYKLSSLTKPLPTIIEKAAKTQLPLLIRGPTGSGKEHLARKLHSASERQGPFIAVNMAALGHGLSQSELFGSLRGAYTGSERDRIGLFEAADRGTIFLDEIGDTPQKVQAELLRVLETRAVRRLGSHEDTSLNFRVIAATHQPLEHLIERGAFRLDLYYRLQGLEIELPALKEIPEEIITIAEDILQSYSESRAFSPAAKAAMLQHPWPGNVRELKQALLRAVTLCDDPTLGPGHFKWRSSMNSTQSLVGYKTHLIAETLTKHNGSLTDTAKSLGLHRSTVHRHLAKMRAAHTAATL